MELSASHGASLLLRVVSTELETPEVALIEFEHAQRAALPHAAAGAHINLLLGEQLERSYSLCDTTSGHGTYQIAVKLEAPSRGGSRAAHDLRPGDTVVARGPFNGFPLDAQAGRVILLAGGIGITPLLAMAREANGNGQPYTLHYFARTAGDAAFHTLLSAAPHAPHAHFHFGLAGQDVADRLQALLDAPPPGTHLYICGPRMFIDLARQIASRAWPAAAVHWELFTAAGEPATDEQQGSFQVKLARSGGAYEVPAGKSILQVLGENGVQADYSCREGMCGMCIARVLEGEPDHRDEFLSDDAHQSGDAIAICVSRSHSPVLILDL
ncbi:PDR/VanB family oxidoreductase [Bordetella sp. BOR01]|uniref:PDR/VanB family oxidoreductase n=1 Tax=Bordetella sp. BOR01 TaxID=2854779 RepID=UPI001C45B14F|nr:PDR/VanB family oxidoreductase [Bordetella sp. BOR01]MBV7483835.1 PDR/VanB family oxidoreductase [Bordetella sp. BOR01]